MYQLTTMKSIASGAILTLILLCSCSKGLNSKPQITIQSINTLIPFEGELNVTIKFVDKSGDLGGGTFTAVYVPTNTLPPPSGNALATVFTDSIPDFPNSTTGQFQYTLPGNSFYEQTLRNDTLLMKFVVTDRSGNTSDTLTSPTIVALYQ
jgi:hypothetical protein